jgi:hypothetical protein
MEYRKILAPGIILYNDLEVAQKILNPLKDSLQDKWAFAEVVNPTDYSVGISESRVCQEYTIFEDVQEVNHVAKMIDAFITPKIDDFKNFYFVEKTEDTGWLALKYDVGGKFDHHVDDGAMFPRTVSMSAYLNDDFEGGEIEFPHFNVLHKPSAGDIIVFSSAFPYLHKVHPVTKGTRYTIVNWYKYPKVERNYV